MTNHCVCDGVNWSDDVLFYTERFEEETSSLDPKARWVPGGEYYVIDVHVRVPVAIKSTGLADEWYRMMLDTGCEHWFTGK